MKILIVEDDQTIGELLVLVLKNAEITPFWAKTAQEACDYLEFEKPDIILLDLFLSGESGLDVFDRCQVKYKPMPPIFLMTAASHPEKITEGYTFNKVLKKPFELEDLESMLGVHYV